MAKVSAIMNHAIQVDGERLPPELVPHVKAHGYMVQCIYIHLVYDKDKSHNDSVPTERVSFTQQNRMVG